MKTFLSPELAASRKALLQTPHSDGPDSPHTPEERAALTQLQSGWSLGLIDVHPWVQPVDSHTLGIGWLTASPAVGAVEWTQDPDTESGPSWNRATDGEDGFVLANTTTQRALLRNWDPTRPVCFRLLVRPITAYQRNRVTFGPEVRSDLYTIHPLTDPTGSTSFLVFNDIHNHPQNFPLLSEAAGPDARFVVFNGDVVQNTMSLAETTENLLLPMTWFSSQGKPVLFVRGNHETCGAYAPSIKQHLCLPNRRTYGAFTIGAARIVFLDAGTGSSDPWLYNPDPFLEEQCLWLEHEITSPEYQSAQWRLVIVHAPPDWRTLGHEKMPCDRFVNQHFVPILDRCPPHAVLGGHTHTPELLEPPPKDSIPGFQFPIFIGGAPDLGRATAIRVDLSPSSLSIALIQVDGSCIAQKSWHTPIP